MKKIYALLSIQLLFFSAALAQTYNSPESVEFDYANNRWFISNHTGHTIITRNSATGALSPFASGFSSGPHGLEIVNDTLYACDGGDIKMYNINTAAAIGTITMGATFLNGITHDNTYLYATDFTAKKIYRINIATRAFSIFVTGLAKMPNGIIYDQPNNRCVFVTWNASAPIMAFDVTSGAVTTVTATTLNSCDGITKDGAGNYYVTAWGSGSTTGTINKFNNTFTTGPTPVVTGLNGPADIFYNTVTDTLGVPNSGTSGGTAGLQNNTTYYYFGSAASTNELEKDKLKTSVDPNPIAKAAEIKYETSVQGKVLILLFNINGQLIKTITDENQSTGKHVVTFDKSGVSAGTYFLKIITTDGVETKKLVIAE
ncbi:MAG: T9SS type A sorting domain-containing protein [Bacteroidia bacterium]